MNPKKDGAVDLNSIDGLNAAATPVDSVEADLKAELAELKATVKALLNQKAAPASPASDLQEILRSMVKRDEVMFRREERLAKAEEAALVAHEAKMKQHKLNQDRTNDDETAPQKNCKHLKGGRGRRKNQAIDYAVYHHQFVDGSKRIRCTICGAFWTPQDTVEFLVRRGKKKPNHTGLGWNDAVRMVDQSTNTPSRSEIRIDVLSQKEAERKAEALVS